VGKHGDLISETKVDQTDSYRNETTTYKCPVCGKQHDQTGAITCYDTASRQPVYGIQPQLKTTEKLSQIYELVKSSNSIFDDIETCALKKKIKAIIDGKEEAKEPIFDYTRNHKRVDTRTETR
jgi:hypothetical protein